MKLKVFLLLLEALTFMLEIEYFKRALSRSDLQSFRLFINLFQCPREVKILHFIPEMLF